MSDWLGAARAWFKQASSDLRTAEALAKTPPPMQDGDTGCHATAMCAQTIEKAIKGYVLLNRSVPALDHRPDKYLTPLLTRSLLQYAGHHRHLSTLFDLRTKRGVTKLLDLTPGATGSDKENTEYPWGVTSTPVGDATFSRASVEPRLKLARRVHDTSMRLLLSVERVR